MDKEEATHILHSELTVLRSKEYQELVDLISSPVHIDIVGKSGIQYQIEVQAFWDNPKKVNKNIRVIASIDDGGFISSFKPLSMDFIMSPTGEEL